MLRSLSLSVILVAAVGCKKKSSEPLDPAPTRSQAAPAGSVASPAGSGSAAAGSTGSSSAGSAAADGVAGTGGAVGSVSTADTDEQWPSAEERERRNGKRTGLGGPDEKPEVIVEYLIRAIAAGKVPAKRFIDPKLGVIERISLPGGADKPVPDVKRHTCGDARATSYIKGMVEAEVRGKATDLYALHCNNQYATVEDPAFGTDPTADKPGTPVPLEHVTCMTGPGPDEYAELFSVVFVPDPKLGLRLAAIVSTEQGANAGKVWAEVATDIKRNKPCK